ncbi:BRO-N domain-containing protein [Nitrosomonas communis]|uniref:BRO family, N-terminal domain n=1 Tax=Nitrosomonas communis TaxID=44574 RepID=A0A1H2WJQ2_9PROT|nr:Bro-N domain-containing protein [Nitrosomonas communis]SDW80229.1 BRO family, N-terminal domain [Nitrosomonas communis]
MSEDKKYEKSFGLDMPMDEAIKRIAKVTKKEVNKKEENTKVIKEGEEQLALFKNKGIRQVFHENEWHFSIVDVIEAITETDRPSKYWKNLKSKLIKKEELYELSNKIIKLEMKASDGKYYSTEVVNVETLFRIVQSIPSKKAEPFKKWLAKVGYERIQEIQNPEIGVKRAILQWQIEGRTEDWIDARIRSIVTRKELTNEWKNRGVQDKEYGYLTNIISCETFGIDVSTHKKVKGLKNHSLRDHMTDLELIFTMLGEKSTTAIAVSSDAQGLNENAEAAKAGGKIAGGAARTLEKKLGKRIVSSDNFLSGGNRISNPKQLALIPDKE